MKNEEKLEELMDDLRIHLIGNKSDLEFMIIAREKFYDSYSISDKKEYFGTISLSRYLTSYEIPDNDFPYIV